MDFVLAQDLAIPPPLSHPIFLIYFTGGLCLAQAVFFASSLFLPFSLFLPSIFLYLFLFACFAVGVSSQVFILAFVVAVVNIMSQSTF